MSDDVDYALCAEPPRLLPPHEHGVGGWTMYETSGGVQWEPPFHAVDPAVDVDEESSERTSLCGRVLVSYGTSTWNALVNRPDLRCGECAQTIAQR